MAAGVTIEAILEDLFRGAAGLEATGAALAALLRARPAERERLAALIEERRVLGRMPAEVALSLARLAAPGAAAGHPAAPPRPDPPPSDRQPEAPPAPLPAAQPSPAAGSPAQGGSAPVAPPEAPLPGAAPPDDPTVPYTRPAAPAAAVEAALLGAMIDRFRGLQARPATPAAPGEGMLDTALGRWRGLRDLARADRGEAAPERPGAAPPGRPIGAGRLVKDRFVLDRLLGRGGMGEVWRAVDRRRLEAGAAEPYVALKLLAPGMRRSQAALRALEREARRAQALSHPNIVTVHDFDRDGEEVFIAMEWLEGQTLASRIAAEGPLAPGDPRLAAWVGAMCAALGHAHAQGIVHSDFKPGNVFATRDGRLKVLDFGIARAMREAGEEEGDLALTPAFASPEMLEGAPADPRDDLYGLGCTVYLLLTGRHPFDRRPALEVREAGLRPARPAGLSRRAWRALRRALAPRRAERLTDAAALATAFAPRRWWPAPWRHARDRMRQIPR